MLKRDLTAPVRVLGSPEEAAAILGTFIGDRATEGFVALYLNARNAIIGYSEMTSNLQAGVEVGVDGVLRDCLLKGGIGIVTAHNHPSGDPLPSEADFALWARLRAAAEIVGLVNLDNLVVTPTHFYSESAGTTRRYRSDEAATGDQT